MSTKFVKIENPSFGMGPHTRNDYTCEIYPNTQKVENIYTSSLKGKVEIDEHWYNFEIIQVQDFSNYNDAQINNEINKTHENLLKVLSFHSKQTIDYLNDPNI